MLSVKYCREWLDEADRILSLTAETEMQRLYIERKAMMKPLIEREYAEALKREPEQFEKTWRTIGYRKQWSTK